MRNRNIQIPEEFQNGKRTSQWSVGKEKNLNWTNRTSAKASLFLIVIKPWLTKEFFVYLAGYYGREELQVLEEERKD
jgi:hypothetical protein